MKNVLSILLLCISCALPVYSASTRTLPLHRSLPLYAEPKPGAHVIVTMEEGKKISFQPFRNGWVKVFFSGNMNVWVASCFLENGVYTKNVIFRTAPTVASSKVTVNRSVASQKAEIIGTDRSGYWKKVRLSLDFTGYVLLSDLEKALKQRENVHQIKDSPIISTSIGRLLPLQKPIDQATHKLVYKVNEAEYLVAYVIPDKVNLKLWEDWMIYISGERIWRCSSMTPFMKGENIFPAYR